MAKVQQKNNHIYMLDTNVLLHDPGATFAFENAHVGIPITVLEELDQFKNESSERGRNAREAIRNIDGLRDRGHLSQGIPLDNGGTLQMFSYRKMTKRRALPLT